MSTFGKTDNGASSSNSATERKCVSSATATTSGIVSSLTARIWLASAGSGHFKGVIYADSAGAPGSLLATTDEVSFTNTSEAEVTASFSGSNIIGIDVGKTYWIGYITGDTSGIAVHQSRADTVSLQKRSNDTYSDGPTDPFGATSDANGKIDCYVTYTDSAIQYDTTSTGMDAADPSSLTWSHTTTTGSNRILVVATSTESDTGGHTAQTVSGITYAGAALTKIRTDYITDNGTELWYLVAPATGANDIVVTMTGTVDGLFGAGLTFTGVHQTNPIDTSAGTTTTGTSISQALTTTAVNDMLVNITQHYNSTTVLTPDAFQTERFNTPTTGDNDQAGGTRLVGATGSYTTSWTNDISDGVTLSVVALRDINSLYLPVFNRKYSKYQAINRASTY